MGQDRFVAVQRKGQLHLEILESRDTPAAGQLDPTFGTGGISIFENPAASSTGFYATAVDLRPDGRIVVGGLARFGANNTDFAIARLTASGALDTTFGTGGLVTIAFDLGGMNRDVVTDLEVQPDGKILVTGTVETAPGSGPASALVRLTPDGGFDPTFNATGKVLIPQIAPPGSGFEAETIAIQSQDGRILVGGTTSFGVPTNQDFAVYRFNTDGTPDLSFNGGVGSQSVSFNLGGTNTDRALAMDVGADGRIVLGGPVQTATGVDFGLTRINPGGTIDLTFGFLGRVVQPFDLGGLNTDWLTDLAVLGDGRVVASGWVERAAGFDFIATRFNANGTPDNTFGTVGRQTVSFADLGRSDAFVDGMAIDADGRIVLAGFAQSMAVPSAFAVARLTPSGQLDTSFNGSGRQVVAGMGTNDQGLAVAVQPDRKVVVAGLSTLTQPWAEVIRLQGTTPPLTPLAVGGSTDGIADRFQPAAGGNYNPNPAVLGPFGSISANVRATTGDVDGNGVLDTILITGPGVPIRFAVVSGVDNATLLIPPTAPFAGSEDFTGGGFVSAADFNQDGRAEMVFTPDLGGGPRVTIFSRDAAGSLSVFANFLGIDDPNFRGGARTDAGFINRDAIPELAVAAGFQGGPRIAIFNGNALTTTRAKLVNDFFAFEDTLRNGAYVAIGDLDNDGFGDLFFGAGPGGAQRLLAISGQQLLAAGAVATIANPLANFFVAGNIADRGGVRVATLNADGDNRTDLAVGSGEGSPASVRVYLGGNFAGTAEPAAFQDLSVFGGAVLTGGVFVG